MVDDEDADEAEEQIGLAAAMAEEMHQEWCTVDRVVSMKDGSLGREYLIKWKVTCLKSACLKSGDRTAVSPLSPSLPPCLPSSTVYHCFHLNGVPYQYLIKVEGARQLLSLSLSLSPPPLSLCLPLLN